MLLTGLGVRGCLGDQKRGQGARKIELGVRREQGWNRQREVGPNLKSAEANIRRTWEGGVGCPW